MSYDELELDTVGDRKTALFLIMSDTDSTFNFVIHDTNSGNPHCHIMLTMRPLDERGIDEIPTVADCQMEKKGIATEKGELNRNIQKANRLIREIRAQIGKLKEWIADLFKARETAPEQPLSLIHISPKEAQHESD